MANNRIDAVVFDIVKAVREVLEKHNVTPEEYRAGVGFLMEWANAADYEVPVMCDLWFNQTIHDVEMKHRQGSRTNMEGPFFLEANVPNITDAIKVREGVGIPFLIRGDVKDLDGKPVSNALIHIWHSEPEGNYSGYSADLQPEFLRGKLLTNAEGRFAVRTTKPVPYRIPHDGPTGRLLNMMGRHPWRPAHVHFKIRKDGFLEHTTQAYFAGEKWVDDDCVDGVRPELIHELKKEQGIQVLETHFVLQPTPQNEI